MVLLMIPIFVKGKHFPRLDEGFYFKMPAYC